MSAIFERFPALRRLGIGRPRRAQVVHQLTRTDCGAACLTMVLRQHGHAATIDEVRHVLGTGRDGVTVRQLFDAGQWYGLRCRAVRVPELELLSILPAGAVLHWDMNHFVVLDRVAGERVHIRDPAFGYRSLTLAETSRSFSGVALLFEPGDTFRRVEPGESRIRAFLRASLSESGLWRRVLVVSLLLQLLSLAAPVLTGIVVDRIVPHHDVDLLVVVALGMVTAVLFHGLSVLIRAHILMHIRVLLDTRLTLEFVDHLVKLPLVFFQQRQAGDLLMRMNSSVSLQEIITSGLLATALDGVLVVLYLAVLLAISPTMTAAVVGVGLLQLVLLGAQWRRQEELMAQGLHLSARSQNAQVEMLTAMETLKSLGVEQRALEQWSSHFVDAINVNIERARLTATFSSAVSALRYAAPLTIQCLGAWLVLSEALSLGTMLAACALAAAFLQPFSSLVDVGSKLVTFRGYFERMDEVLRLSPEQEPPSADPSAEGSRRTAPQALAGAIALDGVSFRYSPTGPLVVKNVSVDIRPGSFVAIVGPSGSGKSTVARLLLGLYAPTAGAVRYDGVGLDLLDLPSVRRQLGIVNQDATLFNRSIRHNISFVDPTLSLEDVRAAAVLAAIDDDVAAMPMGYETPIVNGGSTLSGGQRQRLALARAIASQPAILLLDEATSALDAVTERTVQENLEALACTRIVIAHRLSTVQAADLILVMEGGELVEQGTHEELLEQGGAYRRLISAQLGAA